MREPAGPANPTAREIDFSEYFDAEDDALADFSALDAARDSGCGSSSGSSSAMALAAAPHP